MPGLLALPGHLLRGLPTTGRTIVAVGALLAVGATVWAGFSVVPASREDARRHVASQRAREDARRAERAGLLAVAARPRRGVVPATAPERRPGAEITRRARIVAGLEAAIGRDARARVRGGELEGSILGVRCSRFPASVSRPAPEVDLRRRSGRYECLVVIREFGATPGTMAGMLGHLYRARLAFDSARYAFCKVGAQAGEGGFVRGGAVPPVPRACGG